MGSIVLAIEHTNPVPGRPGTVAIGERLAGPAEVLTIRDVPHGSGERVVATIDGACRDAGLDRSAVDEVALSIGPGGFTSTRIGVVAGVMTAWALGVPIRPVPTALALARATGRDGRVDTALAWRRGRVWWSAWRSGEAVGEAKLIDAGALADHGAESVAAPSDVAEAVAGLGLAIPVEPVSWDASDVLRVSDSTQPVTPDRIAPLYPRRPDAKTIAERTGN